jgi:chemotaxis protein methyltransferase CheR
VRAPDDVRAQIEWARVNLIDADAVRALGRFDIVLCRNVLIYFSDPTVVRVAESLREVIRPGGVLVVGTAESLLRFGTAFQCEERGGAFFYRRPAR